MQTEIREEIDHMIEFYDTAMTHELRATRRLALQDLNDGPVYLDADGESVSCFDEGATRFNFSGAVDLLRDWADYIEDVQIEVGFDEETEESTYESVDGSRDEILKSLFGPLVPYL